MSQKFVLTAAHCLKRFQNDEHAANAGTVTDALFLLSFTVGLGAHEKAQPTQWARLKEIVVHPKYAETKEPDRSNYDMAILRLEKPVEFDDRIRPICLPYRELSDQLDEKLQNEKADCIIAGWGNTGDGSTSKVLQYAHAFIWPPSECRDAYNETEYKLTNMDYLLCARGIIGTNACEGDSGGPLIMESNSTYYALGVTSKGPTECGDSKPVVYTRISKHVEWIQSIVDDVDEGNCFKKPE